MKIFCLDRKILPVQKTDTDQDILRGGQPGDARLVGSRNAMDQRALSSEQKEDFLESSIPA